MTFLSFPVNSEPKIVVTSLFLVDNSILHPTSSDTPYNSACARLCAEDSLIWMGTSDGVKVFIRTGGWDQWPISQPAVRDSPGVSSILPRYMGENANYEILRGCCCLDWPMNAITLCALCKVPFARMVSVSALLANNVQTPTRNSQ